MAQRYLIVNADDFGFSSGINQGIVQAHEHGIVTSASLMVRFHAAAEAAAYCSANPSLSLGLHVDLAEWAYRDGTWISLYEVVPLNNKTAVADEVARQLATFHDLAGRGPTHLDSHQHIHREGPLHAILTELASELQIPLRHSGTRITYCGSFYGQTGKGDPIPQAIMVEGLLSTLESLPAGITELACHPGLGTDFESTYHSERAVEVTTLCDARIRTALAALQIKLTSFRGITNLR